MTDQIKPLKDYMSAQQRFANQPATEVLEYTSRANPKRMCVLVQAGSFEACQKIVADIMDREGIATFTIPALAANGAFVAYGHYLKKDELPEL
jgi:hypothetical protein